MANTVIDFQPLAVTSNYRGNGEANASGVSWPAVLGGAVVAAALSVSLLALGSGLGLSFVSPWNGVGLSASTVGAMAIAWLVAEHAIASAMGGYLAGRLRTRWTTVHGDEVYFRDTAHGFLVWAVGLVIGASLLASTALMMVDGKPGAPPADPNAYYVDALFRADHPLERAEAGYQAEMARIVARAVTGEVAPADQTYLAQQVSMRTNLSYNDAQKRVSDTIAQAKSAADAARKAASRVLLWTFIALLIGAFSASYAATIGGRQRDQVQLS